MSPLPEFAHVAVALADGIAHVEFNRPTRANALNFAMWHELGAATRHVDATPAARVVVLSGGGRHFTAGIDLDFLHEIHAGLHAATRGRHEEFLRDTIVGLQACVTAPVSVAASTSPVPAICVMRAPTHVFR